MHGRVYCLKSLLSLLSFPDVPTSQLSGEIHYLLAISQESSIYFLCSRIGIQIPIQEFNTQKFIKDLDRSDIKIEFHTSVHDRTLLVRNQFLQEMVVSYLYHFEYQLRHPELKGAMWVRICHMYAIAILQLYIRRVRTKSGVESCAKSLWQIKIRPTGGSEGWSCLEGGGGAGDIYF